MERGIYFDGWYRNNHCYHPSLPLRSRQMIDDLEKYRGSLLVWSALGGGSISLPYLEHEAFGEVDPRLRFYGYMNDSEFIRECGKRGIKVFGIVFEVQGWEFPAVFETLENGKVFLKELNVMSDSDHVPSDWYGLREFTQDKHGELFSKKLADYYPDGIYNSLGEPVTDLWEECCARTFCGEPVHADWVEIKDHSHISYQMCRNNPVWRNYLKKIMEIQIDAGVHGIQLDESELPMTSIGAGGCFCKDCMKGFNAYLKNLQESGMICDSLKDMDFDNFHYGHYLQENGLDFPAYYEDVPLYKYYWEYQLFEIKKYFKELVDHAKQYSLQTRGDEVLVSGNFFNLMPSYFSMVPFVDVIITEMKNTLFRQPAWYRYAAGYTEQKPVIVAENPYGGVVPELLNMINEGKGYDLYALYLLEASVYGCNMAVPYGAWMGNVISDAFYPPRELTAVIQNFLADNERLFSKESGGPIGVVYSFPSYYWREAVAGYSNNVVSNADNDLLSYSNVDMDSPNSSRLPFWEVLRTLSDQQFCYDVIMSADGRLRDDDFCVADMEKYKLIVLPDNNQMTERQLDAILTYLDGGGQVLVFGRLALNCPSKAQEILTAPNTVCCKNPADKFEAIACFKDCLVNVGNSLPHITVSDKSLGINTHITPEGTTAVHFLNYNFDQESDRILAIPSLLVTIPGTVEVIGVHTPFAQPVIDHVLIQNGATVITLANAPSYFVIEVRQP